MNNLVRLLSGLVCVAALSGCAMKSSRLAPVFSAGVIAAPVDGSAEVRADRMLIWKANLSVEVWSVSNAVSEATAMTEHLGGFIEQKTDQGEESARVTLRIPAQAFQPALTSLEALGKVTYRQLSSDDVTEHMIDVDARLKNKIVLRDRLQQLLEKAVSVQDVLAIEAELNRVQADIDSMEGRLNSLKGQVDYATVTLNLKRKPIPGPLGYLFNKLWWGVEKLFVIRE